MTLPAEALPILLAAGILLARLLAP